MLCVYNSDSKNRLARPFRVGDVDERVSKWPEELLELPKHWLASHFVEDVRRVHFFVRVPVPQKECVCLHVGPFDICRKTPLGGIVHNHYTLPSVQDGMIYCRVYLVRKHGIGCVIVVQKTRSERCVSKLRLVLHPKLRCAEHVYVGWEGRCVRRGAGLHFFFWKTGVVRFGQLSVFWTRVRFLGKLSSRGN